MEEKDEKSGLSAIIDTVKQSKDVVAEIGDTAANIVSESEILGNIPVLGWGVKAFNIVDKYKLNKFKRNVIAFLQALRNSEAKKIDQLSVELLSNGMSAEFVDTTILVLMESEKPVKAQLLGNLMDALVKQKISFDDFNDLSLIIHAASTPALMALPVHVNEHGFNASCRSTRNEGLLSSIGLCARYGTHLTINELGRLLYQFGFGKDLA